MFAVVVDFCLFVIEVFCLMLFSVLLLFSKKLKHLSKSVILLTVHFL